jgi:hypothetical protein
MGAQSYIATSMTTQAQDTHPQDPIDRFALHLEGLRRMPVPRGIARIVHWLLLEFFAYVLRVAAEIVEQRRNGTLPEPVPAASREARAWPVGLSPRESGWVQEPGAEAARGGGMSHARSEQPEIIEPIAEAPSRTQAVERSGFRRITDAGNARANAERGMGKRSATHRFRAEIETPVMGGASLTILRGSALDSKKWASAGGDTCAHFVTN